MRAISFIFWAGASFLRNLPFNAMVLSILTDAKVLPDSSVLLMDGIYTGIFIVSSIAVTGLFLWGLFGKRHELVKKIIGAELLLLFLLTLLQFAGDCYANMRLLLHAGVNTHMMTMYLCSHFYKVTVLCGVSLYKLILFLGLGIKVAIKRKNMPNQKLEPTVKTPVK